MSRPQPPAAVRALVAVIAAAALVGAAAVALPQVVAHTTDRSDPVSVQLPPPTGPRAIGTFDLRLVDPSRRDETDDRRRPRELMVSLWYPATPTAQAATTPYLPRRIAAFYDQSSAELGIDRGEVDFTGIRTHAHTRAAVDSGAGRRPVLVYSPGGGMPRMLTTALVEDLVSHGYVVMTVDSTGQAPVEFPDGARGPDPDLTRTAALGERVIDLRFVLDQLAVLAAGANPDAQRRPLPAGLDQLLDLDRIGAFGHSLGGFAVAETMLVDPRIDAGANLDGSMPTDVGRAGLVGVDRPFLLMGAGRDGDSTRPHHHGGAPDWQAFWQKTVGWKRDVYFPAGEHMSFTDLQWVLPQLRSTLQLDDEAVQTAIGSVDPAASLDAQRSYLRAFFDLHLGGVPQSLFDPNAERPADRRVAGLVTG